MLFKPDAQDGGLVGAVACTLQITLWLTIAASPLLLILALTLSLGWLWLGQIAWLHYWPWLLLVAGAAGSLAGAWLAERVRRRYGLLAFYARLMNNPELTR
ncbi:hypothetical protein AB2J52_07480 [Aeromonas diversa]